MCNLQLDFIFSLQQGSVLLNLTKDKLGSSLCCGAAVEGAQTFRFLIL